MKNKLQIALIFILLCMYSIDAISQHNIVLNSIDGIRGTSRTELPAPIIFRNVRGPVKILFFGDRMTLERKESAKKSFGRSSGGVDKLETLYSGRIYSEGISETIIFENKTEEELKALDLVVFPKMLEMPYELNIHLTVKLLSDPILSDNSDDAGNYRGEILIKLKNI